MRWIKRVLKGLVLALAVVVAGIILWLQFYPPQLMRVGTGYAAKIVCSNVFLAGRDPDEVLNVDVQAPGNPLLRLVSIKVDDDAGTVTASLFGAFVPQVAARRQGLGCVNVPEGDVATAQSIGLPPAQKPPANSAFWPDGELVEMAQPRLKTILSDARLAGRGMRAMVVIHKGRLIGEAYGPGFTARSPLVGWSMTKTVNAAILGRVALEGSLSLDDAALFPQWSGDRRADITVGQLMAMESGLAFDENYGGVADVTRMLYLEDDMAGYAASLPAVARPGETFLYSSGTAVLLSRIWMDRLKDKAAALAFPRQALFGPLGMMSAVYEADASGTYVGSSYLYATARDWARFGQFLLQGGVWKGQRLLPETFAAAMTTPSAVSGGRYTQGQAWHVGPGRGGDDGYGLPSDITWMLGHDGQSVAIIPSLDLVVVRLGLTPSSAGYRPQRLVAEVIKALQN